MATRTSLDDGGPFLTRGVLFRTILISMGVLTAGLGGGTAWGQTVLDGSITGRVIMPTGEALPGAAVTVASDALVSGARRTESGAGGSFVFLSLPPGSYDLTVGFEGFRTFSRQGIVVTAGDKLHVNVALEIGPVEETLVVTAEAPVVDTRSSTIDTTFRQEFLDLVPTTRDVFNDLPLGAAGIVGVGPNLGWIWGFSAHGGATTDNVFLIDGVDTTDPRGSYAGSRINVNYDVVDEVKVLSLGASPEYPSFSGGAIDVRTKSGGNTFRGEVVYSYLADVADNRGSRFGADWLWTGEGEVSSSGLHGQSAWTATATVGGPVKRDLLWFHATVGTGRSVGHPGLPGADPPEYRGDSYDLKLTAEPGRSHRAWLSWHHSENEAPNGGQWNANLDPTMLFDNFGSTDRWSAQYQWVATDRDILSFKVLGFVTDDNVVPQPVTGKPGYVSRQWDGFMVEGDYPFVDLWESERRTLQADLSHFADDFLGSHELKFGVQYTKGEGKNTGGYFHGYANFVTVNYWSQRPSDWWGSPDVIDIMRTEVHAPPWSTIRELDSTAGFVEDSWRLGDRVTLDLGLRYDRMTTRYGGGAIYALPSTPDDVNHPTVVRTREGTPDLYDLKTWSPRLGAAWTVTRDGRTVLRAHLGRYYAPLGVESLGATGPDGPEFEGFRFFYETPIAELDVNGDDWISMEEFADAARNLPNRTPYDSRYLGTRKDSWVLPVAPGTRSPYTDQFTLSLQRQIGRDLSIEASYIYKNTDDLLVWWPMGPGGRELQWERVPFTTWTGMETEAYQIVLEDFDGNGLVDWDDFLCLDGEIDHEVRNLEAVVGEQAERNYQSLQLVLDKRYSSRWQMLASVNWVRGDGVAPRIFGQDLYIDGPIQFWSNFGDTMNDFTNNLEGPLPLNPEFLVKVSGSYAIPVIETDLGFRVRYDSGRPIWPVQWLPTCSSWHGDFWDGYLVGSGGGSEFVVASDPNDPRWLPSTTILDLRLGKTFSLGRYGDLRLAIDVQNVTNEGEASGVGFYEWDYGCVYSVVPPRITALEVRYSF
jgi:outer membrane receptor protein involved in Fe transport